MRYTFKKDVRGRSNIWKKLQKGLATLLAKTLRYSDPSDARGDTAGIYDLDGRRKYLNVSERRRFLQQATHLPDKKRLFCVLLACSGSRLSEMLATTPVAVDLEKQVITLRTLKRRRPGVLRQVPLPSEVIRDMDSVFELYALQKDPLLARQRLWPWSRTTAWRYIKRVMCAAEIYGPAATPKGLRHAFGVTAFSSVPPHLVQRWLGHANLRTTTIYGDVCGPEERTLAERFWQQW